MIPIEDIRAAAARIAGKGHRTPLLSAAQLGERAGVRLYLKCESFQKTGSFKPRGALNKVLSLSDEEKARGLVTVSAGNHAQAVAWAARMAGASCAVVMPSDAPRSKIEAVKGYGAEVISHGDRATLFDKLNEVKDARGLTFVHPFDDPIVLAGAGTAGLEILEDLPEADIVVVPGLAPALAAGKPVPAPRPHDTLADGMTPPFVGALPLEIAREAVDEIVSVTENEIIQAMKLLMTRAKLYVEGSGAAATAALLFGKVRTSPGARVVAIVSGGNVDLERVASVVAARDP